jgi:hypothetical protein
MVRDSYNGLPTLTFSQAFGTGTQYDCKVGQIGQESSAQSPFIYYANAITSGGAKFGLDSQHRIIFGGSFASSWSDAGLAFPIFFDNGVLSGDSLLVCGISPSTSEFVCQARGGTTFGFSVPFGDDLAQGQVLTISNGLNPPFTASYPVYIGAHCGA